jgi:hypothetical protein
LDFLYKKATVEREKSSQRKTGVNVTKYFVKKGGETLTLSARVTREAAKPLPPPPHLFPTSPLPSTQLERLSRRATTGFSPPSPSLQVEVVEFSVERGRGSSGRVSMTGVSHWRPDLVLGAAIRSDLTVDGGARYVVSGCWLPLPPPRQRGRRLPCS